MNKVRINLISLVIAFITLAFGSMAHAQATRTWVSGVGDDVNPCSRTAPCKTFAGAISKTATGGEINVLDSGGFGAVTITKSIVIDGGSGTMASILSSGTNGIIINAAATSVVVIRNININGAGNGGPTGLNGIRFIAGKELHVENVVIENLVQKGIDVTTNVAGSSLFVRDTIIRNAADPVNGGGIHVHPTAPGTVNVSLDNTRLDRNLFGIRVEDNVKASVRNGVASNSAAGFGYAVSSATSAAEMFIESSVADGNSGGGVGVTGSLAKAFISNVNIYNNGVGLNPGTGQILSFGNNKNAGNVGNNNGAPTGAVLPQQ